MPDRLRRLHQLPDSGPHGVQPVVHAVLEVENHDLAVHRAGDVSARHDHHHVWRHSFRHRRARVAQRKAPPQKGWPRDQSPVVTSRHMAVPFFTPGVGEAEIDAVVECLRSGWLTTGPKTREFEALFAQYVGAQHAVAVNSCTAALHLALEAIGLQRGELVLVPTLTFAATAEVVRYFDAIPVFADADPKSLCLDSAHAEAILRSLRAGESVNGVPAAHGPVRAIIPVHYGGQMADAGAFRRLATEYSLALIEDAAHTLPAQYRESEAAPWQSVGTTADITCFSFYANKCITTGEGGMAVTAREDWADRMRIMSLHGMSRDAWKRFTATGSWYYEIVAPGFKYNLTDIASAIGIAQLARADAMWEARRSVAERLRAALGDLEELTLPEELPNRKHSWHLFAVQLVLEKLTIDRSGFIDALKSAGVASSVHWLPLHMQPYYRESFGYVPDHFPVAAAAWPRLLSLPIFPTMTEEQVDQVATAVRNVVTRHRRRG